MTSKTKSRKPTGYAVITRKKGTPRAKPLTSLETKKAYRASAQTDLQKFAEEEPPVQLSLLYRQQPEWIGSVHLGLQDLSIPGFKALSAVQKLLDQTDYKGNRPEMESKSLEYKGLIRVVTHKCTRKEYLEACGLPAERHHGHQAELLMKALFNELTQTRFISYKREQFNGKPAQLITTMKPLMEVRKVYEKYTPEEEERIRAGDEVSKRLKWLELEVAGIMLEGLNSPKGSVDFYVLKPMAQYEELERLAGKKISQADFLFTDLLLLTSFNPYRIKLKNLAIKLGLAKLLEHRRQTRLDNKLTQAISYAIKAGYLVSYTIKPAGTKLEAVYEFQLNPEKCLRVRQAKPEAGHEENSN